MPLMQASVQHTGNASIIRVRLRYQFAGMPGLPNLPEKWRMSFTLSTSTVRAGCSVICDQICIGALAAELVFV